MEPKLARIRELIDQKERVDAELASLIAGIEKPKRHRRSKAELEADRAAQDQKAD